MLSVPLSLYSDRVGKIWPIIGPAKPKIPTTWVVRESSPTLVCRVSGSRVKSMESLPFEHSSLKPAPGVHVLHIHAGANQRGENKRFLQVSVYVATTEPILKSCKLINHYQLQ